MNPHSPSASSSLPLYRNALEWDHFDAEFPAPDLFEQGVFRRSRDQIHDLQNRRFLTIADVDTGRQVETGFAGNLVVTNLYRTTPPLVRFNLRDLARVVDTGRCACGGYFARIDKFLARGDDMIKLRGVNIYPIACLPGLKSDNRATGEWFCVVDRHVRDGVIRDKMVVKVEVRSGVQIVDGLQEHLERRLRSDLGVKVDVQLVGGEGDLAEEANLGHESKPRRLRDRRNKPDGR